MLFALILLSVFSPNSARAQETEKLGMHVLRPAELSEVRQLYGDDGQWHYVTLPLPLADVHNNHAEWQAAFAQADELRLIPIVRLVTRFENGAWQQPNRRELISYFEFLDTLPWPTDKRHIVVFNEVNHAAEWGGSLEATSYTRVLRFVADWAHSEGRGYVVLPAGLDLAAPNGSSTREAFTYLREMASADPEIFTVIDAWNSHSYPNPAFSAAPQLKGKNMVNGFEYELAYLKEKTGRDFEVFITETGWSLSPATQKWLSQYYQYARQHVWSHPQVVAVTPFVLRGAPGPFAAFSLLDAAGAYTAQATAIKKAADGS